MFRYINLKGRKVKNEIILFENQDVKLEVNMKDETVWLTQAQMSELFDRDVGVISRHICPADMIFFESFVI